jgi:hypothetical protein
MGNLFGDDEVRQRSEALARWRSEVEQRERELRHARRRRRREEQRQRTASEQAAVERANTDGRFWETIDQRISAATAADREALKKLANALHELADNVNLSFDALEKRLGELRTSAAEMRGALWARGAGDPAKREPEEPAPFRFAREKTGDADDGKAADLPNFLPPRRELN